MCECVNRSVCVVSICTPQFLPFQHWFLEGEVICFRDPGHIVLGLIAIFVLFLLVLLIPVVFIFTIVGTSPKLRVITIQPPSLHNSPPFMNYLLSQLDKSTVEDLEGFQWFPLKPPFVPDRSICLSIASITKSGTSGRGSLGSIDSPAWINY